MAALSLRQAAQQAGTSKSTILRAIQSGRLSAGRTDDGGYLIDPAELFRVYPPKGGADRSADQSAGQDAPGPAVHVDPNATELRIRNAELQVRIEALQTILENERRRAEEIRVERDRWADQAQQAQRQLTDQRTRPGLLARLFRKAG